MSRGGRRPGAGRPKGTIGKSTLEGIEKRRIFLEGVARYHEALFNSMLDLALGLCYQGKNGRIYTKKPNLKMIRYMFDQAFGRPPVAKDNVYYKQESEPDYSYIKNASPEEVNAAVNKILGK